MTLPRTSARWQTGLAVCGLLALAALVVWWALRAYNEFAPADIGLAYQGGAIAWVTGHPEHLATWISTPFLGAVMAFVSQLMSIGTAADLITTLNVVLVVATVVVVLRALRPVLSPTWWWIAALGMLSFGPMLSTVWWKQFNLIALVAALAGFHLIRERRASSGAALIGLSIAVKPLAIVLPFVLLARRETRRAGALALGWVIALNVLAQGFMAERAGDFKTLNVLPVLKNFAEKSKPENVWSCHTENFAPGSLLCRLVGGQNWNVQHLVVWAAVGLLSAWVVDALRGRKMISWEVFAFSCAISTMVSPIAWSHYQIMLAPLFMLLLVRFATEGASVGAWAGLLVAFVLASLMWQPFGSSIGAIRHLIDGAAQTQRALFEIADVAQFAQYVLVLTGIIWYLQARSERAISKEGGLAV
jgi:Glycosyltransferase family 87